MGAPRPVRSVRWWSPRWAGLGLLLASGILAGCGSPDLSTSPTPEPRLPFLLAREVANPQAEAIGILLGGCGRFGDVDFVAPDLRAVDGAIVIKGGAHGLYDAGQLTVFYGSIQEAAAAFGGTALFVGPGGPWIRTGPGKARSLVAFRTPANLDVWILKDTAETHACGIE